MSGLDDGGCGHDQLPADVTHIRLVRGMERQVDLMVPWVEYN